MKQSAKRSKCSYCVFVNVLFVFGFRYLLCEGYRELVAKGCCIQIFVLSSEFGLLILVHILEDLADHKV